MILGSSENVGGRGRDFPEVDSTPFRFTTDRIHCGCQRLLGTGFRNMVSTDRLSSSVSQEPLKTLLGLFGALFLRRMSAVCSTSTSYNTSKDTR